MKKFFLTFILVVGVFIVASAGAYACDFCLVSQGISPLDTFKDSGIRINQRYTLMNKVYDGGEAISIGDEAGEEYWTTEIAGFYGITDDITLLAIVPVRKAILDGHLHVHEDNATEVHPDKGREYGLGDVAVIGRYAFFKRHALEATTTVAGLAGIKLPTGKTDGRTSDGGEYLDAHLQLGTGSTDFLVGLSLSHAMQRFSVSANLLAAITTAGEAGGSDHRFGNVLNYDMTAKYRAHPSGAGPSGPQIFLALGLNGELRGAEEENGVELPNSGGHTLYLTPGAELRLAPAWVFEISYGEPVHHDLNGIQLAEDYKVNSAITYLF